MDTREEIVRALIDEMRAKLAAKDDAAVVYFSTVLATFTKSPCIPDENSLTP